MCFSPSLFPAVQVWSLELIHLFLLNECEQAVHFETTMAKVSASLAQELLLRGS